MVRFTVAVELPLAPKADSSKLAHEIVEYLLKPENMTRHLGLRNFREEGHTTEGDQALPRYHFVATGGFKGGLIARSFPVSMSYVQDPTSPAATWSVRTPHTNYFSRTIRVTEYERNNTPVLQVIFDVVVEFKALFPAMLIGARRQLEVEHMSFLLAMKKEFEARQVKQA